MELLVDCLIEDEIWQDCDIEAWAVLGINALFDHLKLRKKGFSICLMACDDARIQELNGGFRGKNKPTNVLSWPSAERASPIVGENPILPQPGSVDEPEELGDIAISYSTCKREADEQGILFEHHVIHLIIHGALHLLGYNHECDEDATLMEHHEVMALERMGINSPY